jgi:CRISPR-associated protein Csx10
MSAPRGFVIEIEALSDMHVGSGAAAGTLDVTVARDAEGLPEIPATTLRGVVRDSAERIAGSLDVRDGGTAWHTLAVALFGSQPSLGPSGPGGPSAGALTLRGARVRDELRSALTDATILPLLTGPRSQVSIERASGTAADDLLRTIEVARPGLLLAADVRIDEAMLGPATEAALALLAVAVGMTTRVGGGRRRGLGRVAMRLTDAGRPAVDDGPLLRLLAEAAPAPVAAAADVPPAAAPASPSDSTVRADGPAVAVTVRMTAIDPLLVPSRTAGNVTESHDHIPGRVILPLVAQAVSDLGVDPGRAIAAGLLRVTDARPEAPSGAGAPTPFCLVARPGAGEVVNRLRQSAVPGMKPLRGGHLSHSGGGRIAIARTGMVLRMHNAVDDRTGRVGDADSGGGLFAVSAIRSESRLAFHVLLAPGSGIDAARLAEALSGSSSIGTARRGSYGSVVLDASVAGPDHRPVEWDAVRGVDAGGTFVVWLVSDCVLLDPTTLAHDPTVPGLLAEIARGLGVDARALTPDGADAVHTRTTRHDAWHSRWGTPRQSLPALRGGSVIRVRTEVPIADERLEALVRDGVGERRGEGFGRIAIDPGWSAHDVLLLEATTEPTGHIAGSPDRAEAVTEEGRVLLERLRTESLVRRAAGLVDAAGRPQDGGSHKHPLRLGVLSRAQRGLLREAASLAASEGDMQPLERFLARQEERLQGAHEGSEKEDRWEDNRDLVSMVGRLVRGETPAIEEFVALARAQGLDVPDATALASLRSTDGRTVDHVRLVAAILIASVRASEGDRP